MSRGPTGQDPRFINEQFDRLAVFFQLQGICHLSANLLIGSLCSAPLQGKDQLGLDILRTFSGNITII